MFIVYQSIILTSMDNLLNLFQSSSSDSDEIILQMLQQNRQKKKRVQDFMTEVVQCYTDEQFRANFRLTRDTAQYIIDLYKSSTFFEQNIGTGRRSVSPERQALAFLWFAANKDSYREVGNIFNMTESTCFKHFDTLLNFFHDISRTIIKFPQSDAEKETIARDFEKLSNFKNVIGCIDGSYISIRKPKNKIRSTYTNRHDMLSITLQAICDKDKKFLDVFIGPPSKVHDSRIFSMSSISRKLPDICGQKYHLLGDAAYPIREYLLTPYRDNGHMTNKKIMFNLHHCQTRVVIENCFGLLKQRFRQLTRLDFHTTLKHSKFVMACCVLHNICIVRNDTLEVGTEQTSVPSNVSSESRRIENGLRNEALRRLGELKRDAIANYFTQ
ncbi:putative nuclease HARBI1 [Malaya genurostris]|uniref:putative nuclease HARBI1 n=1 Tax=Malaya genurostris TaxID=325434 RepID=UPI0026F3DE04|nr:putative nuclease HARBI1 [Malaya genurostris]